jgi:hypothetical protein
MTTIPSFSREDLSVPFTVRGTGAALLTTWPVEWAFTAERTVEPDDDQWVTAGWDPDTADTTCLVGPETDADLPVGTYWVWVQVTGPVVRPVRQVGLLHVT